MSKRLRTKFEQKDIKGNLICYCCKQYKPTNNFDINKERWFREFKDYRCKECKSKQIKKRKENNRGKKDLDRLLLERWHGVKDRAKRNSLIIDFDWLFLKDLWDKQNGVCAISGINMTFEMDNGRVYTNLSVDRKDSNIGYIKDNIHLVCMAVNQMKSDLTLNELLYFCESIIKNNKL